MSFLAVKNKIKEILDTLTGDQPEDLFLESFDYLEPQPDNFPCAMIGTFSGGGTSSREEIQDSAYNVTNMEFFIHVEIPNDQTDRSATHDLLLSTIDGLLAELRKDEHYTLGGLVQEFKVSPRIDTDYALSTSEPTITFEVALSMLKLNQTF